eukprot:gene5379-10754_t
MSTIDRKAIAVEITANSEDEEELDMKMRDLISRHREMKEKIRIEQLTIDPESLMARFKDAIPIKNSKSTDLSRPNSARLSPARVDNRKLQENRSMMSSQNLKDSKILIGSPARGKIRPRSVMSARKFSNQMQSNTPLNSKPPIIRKDMEHAVDMEIFEDEDRIGKFLEESRIKSENEIRMRKQNLRPLSAPMHADSNPKLNRAMSATELTRHLQLGPGQKFRRTPSAEYLKIRKQKEKDEDIKFSTKLQLETNILQTRCFACIGEANNFAKSLGKKVHFAMYTRGLEDEVHWDRIRLGGEVALKSGIAGAGRRLEKMTVEMVTDPNKPVRLLSMDAFFREHARLHYEIRRRKSLQPLGQMATTRNNNNNDNSNNSKQKQQEFEFQTAEEEEANKESLISRRKFSIRRASLAVNILNKPKAPASQSSLMKNKKTTSSRTSKQQSTVKKELSRKETEDKLIQILENTSVLTKILENQLHTLRAKGWNAEILDD